MDEELDIEKAKKLLIANNFAVIPWEEYNAFYKCSWKYGDVLINKERILDKIAELTKNLPEV